MFAGKTRHGFQFKRRNGWNSFFLFYIQHVFFFKMVDYKQVLVESTTLTHLMFF
jgi:hypothetical protein